MGLQNSWVDPDFATTKKGLAGDRQTEPFPAKLYFCFGNDRTIESGFTLVQINSSNILSGEQWDVQVVKIISSQFITHFLSTGNRYYAHIHHPPVIIMISSPVLPPPSGITDRCPALLIMSPDCLWKCKLWCVVRGRLMDAGVIVWQVSSDRKSSG